MRRTIPPEERFWPKVDKTGDCWLWTAAISDTGYGSFNAGAGRYVGAHRFAYEALVGPIPKGLQIDHLCRNPLCVNPTHMEPVDMEENLRRAGGRGIYFARRTHCKHGHEFAPENTWVYTREGRPYRVCKTCHKRRSRKRQKPGKDTAGDRHHSLTCPRDCWCPDSCACTNERACDGHRETDGAGAS